MKNTLSNDNKITLFLHWRLTQKTSEGLCKKRHVLEYSEVVAL